MSTVDDLIAKMCPDGVEHKPLAAVGEFTRGNGLQKKDFVDDGFPCIHYGQIYTRYGTSTDVTHSFVAPDLAARLRKASHGALIIATTSENAEDVCKAVTWMGEGDVAVSGDSYVFSHSLNPLYVAYFFQTESFRSQKVRHVTGTKVKRLSGEALAQIRIPVPPPEVQREIVRILDTFTSLEAELEAELEARRVQYEHYRDALLRLDDQSGLLLIDQMVAEMCPGGVAFEALDDVIEDLRTGLNPRQNFKLNPPDAVNLYITVRELDGFSLRPTDRTDRVDDDGLLRIQARSRLKAGDVLFSGTGTIGRTALIAEDPHDWNIKEGVYAITPKPARVLSRFLIYILHSSLVRNRILASADGATVASVSMTSLRRIRIPVPPPEIQHEIVSILDAFDGLVNDLSAGLPAEIAARRQQYEHYRDRLLIFDEAPA